MHHNKAQYFGKQTISKMISLGHNAFPCNVILSIVKLKSIQTSHEPHDSDMDFHPFDNDFK